MAVWGVIPGIGMAVAIAVLEFLWDGWRPHHAVMGRVQGIRGFHDIRRHPGARQVPGLVPQEAQPQATDLTGSATILLVEDEEAVRAFGKRALMSRGYTVHEAGSGTEALAVMEETGGSVDLVVSDVVMPEMDGPSLLRELRKTRPDLKIIFVSGYAEDAFAKNLPEGEQFHFLPKPFSLKQLATAVKEALGR